MAKQETVDRVRVALAGTELIIVTGKHVRRIRLAGEKKAAPVEPAREKPAAMKPRPRLRISPGLRMPEFLVRTVRTWLEMMGCAYMWLYALAIVGMFLVAAPFIGLWATILGMWHYLSTFVLAPAALIFAAILVYYAFQSGTALLSNMVKRHTGKSLEHYIRKCWEWAVADTDYGDC